MKLKLILSLIAALAGMAALALGAGASTSASGTLQLGAKTAVKWDIANCPAGTSSAFLCYAFVGDALVPGLGRVTATITRMWDGGECPRSLPHAVLEVAGKGAIDLELLGPACVPFPPAQFSFDALITGGSGLFAGASGSLRVDSTITESEPGHGQGADVWSGALNVAGLDFDLMSPTIAGAVSKTVRAAKNATRMRVRYAVTAQDAVDGAVPISCRPRSGGFFKLGRTSVACTAVDSSGNTARARFAITVRRSS